jgi:hypothetical protein
MTTTALIPSPTLGLLPARLFAPTPKAARRFWEFFAAQLANDHTRKAYLNAARRFAGSCDARTLDRLRKECLRDGGRPRRRCQIALW